jgi:ATP-dependent Clp protease ATP-binding subunit ClpA
MDHGTLTDNNGAQADFRHVIIVLTTNAGAHEMSRRSIGFNHEHHVSESNEAINRMFPPEFRNRLDRIIQFEHLSMDIVASVVDKFLVELQAQLDEKGVVIDVSDNARIWLSEKGYDITMGARPMARLIQQELKLPLAEQILFGELSHGGHVHVDVKNDKVTLEYVKEEAVAD